MDRNKTQFYEGVLGYEAIICTECGAFSDHLGFFPANQWSLEMIGKMERSGIESLYHEQIEKALMKIGVGDEPSIDMDILEIQFDEKPNGVVIRVNSVRGCILRICGIPKELVFDENGKVREFVDIAYPKLK
jgi:hypothetical protein